MDHQLVKVTVSPGRSMREPIEGGVTIGSIKTADGGLVSGTIDSRTRAVLPGQTLRVRSDAVDELVALGTILDPRTGQPAPTLASGPALRS